MRSRLAVFASALIPRLAIAWITFGPVDAVNNFRNFVRMLEGVPALTPYLPGVELLIWIASTAAYYTPLPLTLPYKIVPLVCDALIAVALHDSASDRRQAWRNGMLYAIAPVPFFLTALHPQWDASMLYPLVLALLLLRDERTSSAALAGAALVLSIVVKPIAPPLLPFLVPWHRRRAVAFLGGAIAAAIAYVAILFATGYTIDAESLAGIGRYAGGGVQLFGLAFRPHNRLLVVAAAFALTAFLFFRRRCSRDEAVLLFFSIVLAFSGLAVQYLCWLVPFAILCGRIRFLAVYGAAAGLFLLFFYRVPVANLPNAENLGTFALLRPFGAFSPPLPPPWAATLVRILGNAVIPLVLLTFATWWIVMMVRRTRVDEPVTARPSLHLAAALLIVVALATIWSATRPRITPEAFVARVEQKAGAYDVVRYPGPSKIWIARAAADPAGAHPVLNLGNLLLLWLVAATAATVMIARR